MDTIAVLLCPCGCGLSSDRWTDAWEQEAMFQQIMEHGPLVRLTVDGRTWMIPRLYIAFHGITANRIPVLAAKHHWPEVARIH